jgi:pre-mRNA-splicing factor SPF27
MNNHSCSKILVCSLQNNPLLASELERVGARQPLAAIDTARYQLTPSSTTPSSDEEWKSALDGAYALLEHQRIRYGNPYSQCDMRLISSSRHNNLALLQQYGNNAWRVHNYLLEADTKKAENLLEELKERTTGLNRDRKNTQVHVIYDPRHTRC